MTRKQMQAASMLQLWFAFEFMQNMLRHFSHWCLSPATNTEGWQLTCPGKAARTSCSVTSRTQPSLTSLRRRTPRTRLPHPSETRLNYCGGIKMACCTHPGFTQSSTSNSATSGCIMGNRIKWEVRNILKNLAGCQKRHKQTHRKERNSKWGTKEMRPFLIWYLGGYLCSIPFSSYDRRLP